MPNPPYLPQLQVTGDDIRDIKENIDLIYGYLQFLQIWLAEGEVDPGWSVSGTVERKQITGTETLTQLMDFVGTLAQLLATKGILGG